MGAFQAHELEKMLLSQQLEPSDISHRLDLCSTAVRFQLIHAVALMGIAVILYLKPDHRIWKLVGCGFCIGVSCFCGSLYGLSLANMKQLSHIAPIGGISLMASWVLVAVGSFWFEQEEE